jgi:cell wall-associated NlpC family hydrolase
MVQIDTAFPLPPVVAEIQAQFSQFAPSSSGGLPAPSDPFSVLLDAVSASSTSTAAPTATSGSDVADLNSTSVEPELVSLGGSSAAGAPGDTAATSTASGSAIVSEASKFLGVPYVWGGTSPSGFDCSGLVQYVFGQLGVEVPRGSVDQSEVGSPVASLSQAQPGDLLFFEPGENGAPPGKPGHVGIYIGNGQMIDAPETGETVQVQAIPCTPIAIRRITVPVAPAEVQATSPSATVTSGGTVNDALSSGTLTAASATGAVQMGEVSVPAQYAGLVEQASTKSGTPAPLLAAILYNESRFSPDVVSSAGAEGIAQFMPATAAANGVNPFDPPSAISGAASLLAQFHSAFGSWTDAVAAYAAGGGAVEAAGGVPEDGTTPAYVTKTLAEAGMAVGS